MFHSLDLIMSPRNPLDHPILERSAATHTTTVIISNLFMTHNDIIDLSWYVNYTVPIILTALRLLV